MKALTGIITALSIPLMVLNTAGGIVSGIWLAVLGDWSTIVFGIGLFLVSTLILGIAMMPSALLAAPTAMLFGKGNKLGALCFGALSSLYVVALITIWCCGMLFLFVVAATKRDIIPRLIWS